MLLKDFYTFAFKIGVRGFPLRGYSIPGRNGTWAWTPWEILLGAPPPSSPLEGPIYYPPTYLPTYMPKEWAYMPTLYACRLVGR